MSVGSRGRTTDPGLVVSLDEEVAAAHPYRGDDPRLSHLAAPFAE